MMMNGHILLERFEHGLSLEMTYISELTLVTLESPAEAVFNWIQI